MYVSLVCQINNKTHVSNFIKAFDSSKHASNMFYISEIEIAFTLLD